MIKCVYDYKKAIIVIIEYNLCNSNYNEWNTSLGRIRQRDCRWLFARVVWTVYFLIRSSSID